MEFFRILTLETSETELQEKLVLSQLEAYSTLFFPIGELHSNQVEIGGLWGEFTLVRSEIKGGLRFALKECPNALCWTLTTGYPPKRDALIIHLTINRQQKKPDFLEEIEDFLDDHQACLEEFLKKESVKIS